MAILEAVADRSLWKAKIHETMEADRSLQAVGRRVENLVDDGYMESTIIAPDEISPDLIIAFKPTEQGREVIKDGDADG